MERNDDKDSSASVARRWRKVGMCSRLNGRPCVGPLKQALTIAGHEFCTRSARRNDVTRYLRVVIASDVNT
jgi:hypothetical protein